VGVIYLMSSKVQADSAVLRLMQSGLAARLLPDRPTDLTGQWLEVDVDDVEQAAALRSSAGSTPPHGTGGLTLVAPWNATGRCTILDNPRPVQVHQEGSGSAAT